MKRVLLPALLIVPILLGLSQTALAKALTAKLIIEGGSLTKQLELTDPRILGLSNIWSGTDNFLDNSREPAKKDSAWVARLRGFILRQTWGE